MLTNVRIVGFEWDRGNRSKCQKHGVSLAEIEAVLLPTAGSFVFPDVRHSRSEPRFIAIGGTEAGRGVFAVFNLAPTWRGDLHPARQRPLHAPKGGRIL